MHITSLFSRNNLHQVWYDSSTAYCTAKNWTNFCKIILCFRCIYLIKQYCNCHESLDNFQTFSIRLRRSSMWKSLLEMTLTSILSIQSHISLNFWLKLDQRNMVSSILWARRLAWFRSSSHCLFSSLILWCRTFKSSGSIVLERAFSLARRDWRLGSALANAVSISWRNENTNLKFSNKEI